MITYNVKRIRRKTDFLKPLENVPWEKANVLMAFQSPWDSMEIPKTRFRALYDSEYLFFRFDAEDHSIHINEQDASYESIGDSDRVEIFFRKNRELNPYYCMEMDSGGRLMDFRAYPHRKFDFNWNFGRECLNLKTYKNDAGYIVKGAIKMELLEVLNLIHQGNIETGIYRAKYIKKKGVYSPVWISWVNPHTTTPDFHNSTSFGKINLL